MLVHSNQQNPHTNEYPTQFEDYNVSGQYCNSYVGASVCGLDKKDARDRV